MPLVNAYATVAHLRTHMTDENSIADTTMLERALNTASRQIDAVCGRRFWLDGAATVRTYKPTEPDIAWVDDIASTVGLIVETDTDDDGVFDETWDSDEYELEPANADSDGGAYAWWRLRAVGDLLFPTTSRRRRLRVTALHGWSSVPPDVEQACLLRAAGLYKRRDSPQGIAGFDGFGAVLRTRLDPDVAALLRPFMKVRIGAV